MNWLSSQLKQQQLCLLYFAHQSPHHWAAVALGAADLAALAAAAAAMADLLAAAAIAARAACAVLRAAIWNEAYCRTFGQMMDFLPQLSRFYSTPGPLLGQVPDTLFCAAPLALLTIAALLQHLLLQLHPE